MPRQRTPATKPEHPTWYRVNIIFAIIGAIATVVAAAYGIWGHKSDGVTNFNITPTTRVSPTTDTVHITKRNPIPDRVVPARSTKLISFSFSGPWEGTMHADIQEVFLKKGYQVTADKENAGSSVHCELALSAPRQIEGAFHTTVLEYTAVLTVHGKKMVTGADCGRQDYKETVQADPGSIAREIVTTAFPKLLGQLQAERSLPVCINP